MSSVGSGGPTSWQASLLQAASKGDEPRVRELVREGVLHGDKFTVALRIALQKVAGRGHEGLTRLLLEEGADVNIVADGEPSPLLKAAEAGHHHVVRILLEHGADTESCDRTKRTSIFAAAQKNHCTTLKALLEAGANANVRDGNGQNLMLYLASEKPDKAVKWGDEVVRTLLSTDIDLETRDKEGRTALLWAAAYGRASLATLLLTGRQLNCADIGATNHRGKTALHLAAENNRVALVKILLENGAYVHARSDGGWTALHNVAEKGHVEIARLLLEWGAKVNATTSSGMTALHWSSRNGHLAVVNLLLQQAGVRRNPKDSFDSTPMLGAAQNGHIDIVERLSPADDGDLLSESARGACKGFQATVVDFGMEHRPMHHTKYSVYDVLYGWDTQRNKPTVTTLTRNIPAKPNFRWIHLPTNNMTWVEALVTKHFVENRAKDVEGFKLLEKSFVQLHHGPTIHSHFMRPLCQRMPPTGAGSSLSEMATNSQEHETKEEPKTPTLKVEITPPTEQDTSKKPTEKAAKTLKKPVKKGEKADKPPGSPQTPNTPKKTGKPARPDASPHGRRDGRPQARSKSSPGKPLRKLEPNGNIVLFMPYLHYETHQKRKEMSNVIKRATAKSKRHSLCHTSDEMLIEAYLHSTHNLQIRRTLDQFYYHAISTDDRDEDQVVYRYTKDKGKEVKVFMVDQLWLWILSDDLIITSFPQRWEQPKNDPLNVLDGIIEDMSSKTRPPVKSIYDLATLITGRCSGVFDRHRVGDEDYQFLDMFESSIGEVTDKETELFKKFNDASRLAAKWLKSRGHIGSPSAFKTDRSDMSPAFVDTLLDIGQETALLAETKDIRDELNMISLLLNHQLGILEDLAHALLQELKGRQDRQAEIKRRFRELSKVVEVHLKDVERMDKQAESLYDSLAHLLDLKQKHANAFEARFARDQATFTGRQGQTILVFTIVTVIFLPMSFIAAVFTIPIRDFPHQSFDGSPSLPMSYVSKFVFGVGLAISIPLVAVAFAADDIGFMFRRWMTRFSRWTSRNSSDQEHDGASEKEHEAITTIDIEVSAYAAPGVSLEKQVSSRRRSGDSYKRTRSLSRSIRRGGGAGYESDDRTDINSSPFPSRHRKSSLAGAAANRQPHARWKDDERDWNGNGNGNGNGAIFGGRDGRRSGSRDLERGNVGMI